MEGGGAKNINFQELAADLAQITFDYPFRIPPYFALIIRAISVLEGIALVGNPDFAIVDEAYPYLAERLLTDDSPRLREALKYKPNDGFLVSFLSRYMIYGKNNVFDAERLVDLLSAFESFKSASISARGSMSEEENNILPPSRNQRTLFPRMEDLFDPRRTQSAPVPQFQLPVPLAFLSNTTESKKNVFAIYFTF